MEGFGSLGGPAGLAGIHEDHDAAPDFERTTMPEVRLIGLHSRCSGSVQGELAWVRAVRGTCVMKAGGGACADVCLLFAALDNVTE